MSTFDVEILFHSAHNLPIADFNSLACDPYIHATINVPQYRREEDEPPLTFRTPTVRRTRDAEWCPSGSDGQCGCGTAGPEEGENQTPSRVVNCNASGKWIVGGVPATGFELSMLVRDEDPGSTDDRLGTARIRIPSREEGSLAEGWKLAERRCPIKKRKAAVRVYVFTYAASMLPGVKLDIDGYVIVSARVIGPSRSGVKGRVYTVGPGKWSQHFSPLIGAITPLRHARPAKGEEESHQIECADGNLRSRTFVGNKLQLAGPVPDELRHHFVGYRPFMNGMFNGTGVRGHILNMLLHKQYRTVYSYDKHTRYGIIEGDGVGAEAPGHAGMEDKAKDDPSDGKTEDAPSDGKAKAVPSDGKAEGVPSNGEVRDDPSDGKAEDVPSDGKAEDVHSDGKAEDVQSDAKAQGVPSDGAGGAPSAELTDRPSEGGSQAQVSSEAAADHPNDEPKDAAAPPPASNDNRPAQPVHAHQSDATAVAGAHEPASSSSQAKEDEKADMSRPPKMRAFALQFLRMTGFGAGGRIFTYVITLDGEFRWTETGEELSVDLLSKHTLHADVAKIIAWSGEFFVRRVVRNQPGGGFPSAVKVEEGTMKPVDPDNAPEGDPKKEDKEEPKIDPEIADANAEGPIGDEEGNEDPADYELVIDNDSGTYRPKRELLSVLRRWLASDACLGGLGRVTCPEGFDPVLGAAKKERTAARKKRRDESSEQHADKDKKSVGKAMNRLETQAQRAEQAALATLGSDGTGKDKSHST